MESHLGNDIGQSFDYERQDLGPDLEWRSPGEGRERNQSCPISQWGLGDRHKPLTFTGLALRDRV